jgi:hypothetical protein
MVNHNWFLEWKVAKQPRSSEDIPKKSKKQLHMFLTIINYFCSQYLFLYENTLKERKLQVGMKAWNMRLTCILPSCKSDINVFWIPPTMAKAIVPIDTQKFQQRNNKLIYNLETIVMSTLPNETLNSLFNIS